jgi:hypothetical protein
MLLSHCEGISTAEDNVTAKPSTRISNVIAVGVFFIDAFSVPMRCLLFVMMASVGSLHGVAVKSVRLFHAKCQ